jgi:hypothetical protein
MMVQITQLARWGKSNHYFKWSNLPKSHIGYRIYLIISMENLYFQVTPPPQDIIEAGIYLRSGKYMLKRSHKKQYYRRFSNRTRPHAHAISEAVITDRRSKWIICGLNTDSWWTDHFEWEPVGEHRNLPFIILISY